MSGCFGLDMSPSNVRWAADESPGEFVVHEFPKICGCPANPRIDSHPEYEAADNWGDSLAFRGHNFTYFTTGNDTHVDDIGRFLFVEPEDYYWLRPFFSRSCTGHPPVLPGAILTAAIPNAANSKQQDEVLANLPTGYGGIYLLWRPVALAMDWLENLNATHGDASQYLSSRVFTLDLDGGFPEVAEIGLCRHKTHHNWIVPVRKPLGKGCRIIENWQSDLLASSVLSGIPERDQLLKGPFAPAIQAQLESGSRAADMWVRVDGMWEKRHIPFAAEPDPVLLELAARLLGRVRKVKRVGDVIICHGWFARRYARHFRDVLGVGGAEVVIARAESVCEGACLFSRRIANNEPTYYDVIPDYSFWDGKAGEWKHLFDTAEPVEPASVHSRNDIRVMIEKNNDNVSIYVRNGDEATEEEDARRLKVSFSTFLASDVPLRLGVTVRIARGSAELAFEMEDGRQPPVFLVDEKPSRTLRFKYTVGDGGMITGSPEPLHRGMPEPQPVLGRIYDSKENVEMVRMLLTRPNSPECRAAILQYRLTTGFTARDELITARVGYDANPRQPTRGLLGTKRLPNMPEVDELARKLAEKSAVREMDEKRQNYCHSAATESYKTSVRKKLKARVPQSSWNFCYAPGYVLGDKPGDFELLIGYLVVQQPSGFTTGKLWWSVFRMLCWHPEACVTNTALLEKALWKAVKEDAVATSVPERKYVVLGILYSLRAREIVNEQGVHYDFPEMLKRSLIQLLMTGVLANEPFPKTMLPNFQMGGTMSEYVVRFINKTDTLRDRELGAQMGCV